jgi:hypothetical protein
MVISPWEIRGHVGNPAGLLSGLQLTWWGSWWDCLLGGSWPNPRSPGVNLSFRDFCVINLYDAIQLAHLKKNENKSCGMRPTSKHPGLQGTCGSRCSRNHYCNLWLSRTTRMGCTWTSKLKH